MGSGPWNWLLGPAVVWGFAERAGKNGEEVEMRAKFDEGLGDTMAYPS